jgi:hypothetical protein
VDPNEFPYPYLRVGGLDLLQRELTALPPDQVTF